MEQFVTSVKDFLPDNAFLQYVIIIALIVLYLLVLRYVAKGLQRLSHYILDKKKAIAKSWLHLMDKNKLLRHIFFAVGVGFLAGLSALFLKDLFPQYSVIIVRLLYGVFIVSVMLCFSAALGVITDKYSRSLRLPIKGIVQAVKVILWIITLILILSVMIDKDPVYFLGGLTALSAVIMLVFKDSILGLASGFQLMLNDLVRVGDWIEMPNEQANGIVIDILLTTVRVQNWDNTIVNIPAYDLASSSFKNWRGMTDAGARRIQHMLKLDLKSIRPLKAHELDALKKNDYVKPYIESWQQHKDKPSSGRVTVESELTNLALFRVYCAQYVKNIPEISTNYSIIVHLLTPTSEGQPLEILSYASITDAIPFETLQSEMLEHMISRAAEFKLNLYQKIANAEPTAGK